MSTSLSAPIIPAERLWTVREVCEFLRVGRNAVYEMAQNGVLPSFRVGARVRFVPDEIRAWLVRQRKPEASRLPVEPRQP